MLSVCVVHLEDSAPDVSQANNVTYTNSRTCVSHHSLTQANREAENEANDAHETEVRHPGDTVLEVEGHGDGDARDDHSKHAVEQEWPAPCLLHQGNL